MTDGHPRLRRATPALAGAAFFVLMAALYVAGLSDLYRGIIIAWGIDPFAYPFVDTDTYLSAVRCLRQGVDVYAANPCDPLQRVYDYSPLWMALTVFPMTLTWLTPFGLATDIAFLGALLLLPPGRDWRATGLITLAVLSSATLFAVERGNNDLVLFTLAAGAAVLVCKSPALRVAAYGLALLAGLLKYYPMTLMLIATRERPGRLIAVALTSVAVLALFIAITWHDLHRVLQLIPTGSPFGNMFGAVTVGAGFAQKARISPETAHVLRIAMTLASLAIGAAAGLRTRAAAALVPLTELERSFLLVGALLILSCFFTAQNIGYRAVHIILILPALTALARRDGRKLFLAATIAALALIWGEIWRNGGLALGELIGDRKGRKIAYWATWAIREAMWWWLVTLLISCVTSLLATSTAARETMAAWPGRHRRRA